MVKYLGISVIKVIVRTIITLAIFGALIDASASPAFANSQFELILKATQSILEGRTFQSDDGTMIHFGELRFTPPNQAEMTVKIKSATGIVTGHREVITEDQQQVRLQIIDSHGSVENFLATLENPFEVLRIRPLDTTQTHFISRECAQRQNSDLRDCYYKVRNGYEVFVTVFKEVTSR